MWTWGLNWDPVRDDLLVGSCPITCADLDRIRQEAGASAILSLQTEACRASVGADYDALLRHAQEVGLVLENTPMRDFDPQDQRRRLPAAVQRLHALVAAGHRVYVHCTAGVNRSPLTVLGYLTFVEGLPTRPALELIRAGRPVADPYLDAYEGCRSELLNALRDLVAARAAVLGGATVALLEPEVLRQGFTQPESPAGARVAAFVRAPGG